VHRLIAIVLVTLLPAGGAPAAAAPSAPAAYEVEVVVFENRLPDLEGGELWTWSSKKTPAPTDAVAPPAPAGGSELANTVATLQNDPRYRVLLHQRWVQPAEAKAATKPVVVQAPDREVDGILLFYVNRFLHVELSLGFQPPRGVLGSEPAAEPTGALYRINEQRRVKSQEIHYFDHPKFGALVRIVPAASGAISALPATNP